MDKLAKKKITIGFLILVVLSTSFYLLLPEKVRIDVQKTRTEFRVWENEEWVLGAKDYVNIFDGTKKMRARLRVLFYGIDNDIITIVRKSLFKNNITIIDTYTFDGSVSDVERVPIEHIVECCNCEGKIIHFEYKDILYTGKTKKISSPFSFGHKMKLEWQDGAYFAKVYQQKYAPDKIVIRYKPETNYEIYKIRLFDPELQFNKTFIEKKQIGNITKYRFKQENNDISNIINHNLIIVETDGINNIEIIDYNYSHVGVKYTNKIDEVGKVKLTTINDIGKVIEKKNISYIGSKVMWLDFENNKKYSFGDTSTTIYTIDTDALSINLTNAENIYRSSSGKLHVGYTYNDLNGEASYCNSSNDGVTWSCQELTWGSHSKVGITGNSTSVAVYYESGQDLFAKVTHDEGASFDSEVWIAHRATGNDILDDPSCMAHPTTNVIYCCCIDEFDDALLMSNSTDWSTSPTGNIMTDININSFDDSDTCDIAIDNDGCIFIVASGTDQDDIDIWGSCLNGWGSSDRVSIHDGTSFSNPTITVDVNDNLYVTYHDNAGDVYFANSTDGGSTWSTQKIEDTISGKYPDIAITNDNNIFIVYSKYYRNSTNFGTDWSDRVTFTDMTTTYASIGHSLYPSSNNIDDVFRLVFTNSSNVIFYQNMSLEGTIVDENNISTCTNITSSGTYQLTADITNSNEISCINISADNVVLNCQGHIIDGIDTGDRFGIYSKSTKNITVRNCTVTDWADGIRMDYVNDSLIDNCTMYSNSYSAWYVTVDNLNTTNIISGTGANNYGIYYTSTSKNFNIENITALHDNACISIIGTDFTIKNVTLSDTDDSEFGTISFENAKNGTLIDSIIKDGWYGVEITGSTDNITISNNTIKGFTYAFHHLFLSGSHSIKIYNNLINATNYVKFDDNMNCVWNTTNQTSARIYSSGTNIGGNYWTNSAGNGYSDICTDSNTDGFCDTAFNVTSKTAAGGSGDNLDYLPLSSKYGAGSCEINISFGPPSATTFRFLGCGPDKENSSSYPQWQDNTYGIDYICNNGTAPGELQVRLADETNTGWTIYASNTSPTQDMIYLNTTWRTLYNTVEIDECKYVWFMANCTNVTQNPGTWEEYRIVTS